MLCIAQSSQLDRDDRMRSSPEAWLKPAAEMRRLFEDLPEAIENSGVIARRCAFGAPKRKPILPSIAAAIPKRRPSSCAATPAPASRRGSPTVFGAERGRAQGLFRPARIRSGRHRPDGLFGLLPDRRRLHQMGQAERHTGRPGPRLRRGLGGRLGADHHRSRPDPRSACCSSASSTPSACRCRTSTSTSARPGAARSSATSSSATARDKVAQIITFGKLKARAVLKDTGRVLQMPYGQVDRLAKAIPNHPTDPWTLERALNGVTELAAEYKNDTAGPPAVRPGDEARGPAAPRLDPRRRRGHRRPAARQARPALPRSALGHAGHPVRHEICRGGGAGEVRLPRPEDPVGASEGGADARRSAASRPISTGSPGTIRRSTNCSSAATRSACSSSNRKACGARWRR